MNKTIIFMSAAMLTIGLFTGAFLFGTAEDNPLANLQNCDPEGKGTSFSCAMHSQIRLEEQGPCPLCGMQLTSADLMPQHNPDFLKLTEAALLIAGVETVRVKKASHFEKEITVYGKVAKDKNRTYKQIAHLPGRIENFYANEVGQYVRKGQKIASVYSKEFIAVIEAFEYSKRSESVLRSAENNLLSWKISKSQLKEFDIKGDYQKSVDVLADRSGVITKVHAQAGDQAVNTHMGMPTVYYEIADFSQLWVLFEIYEKDLGFMDNGNTVSFTVSAYPERIFEGKISQINPEINPATRTVSAKVIINNTEGLLKPEMLATGKIKIKEKMHPSTLSIPKSAVLWAGDRAVVYVKRSEYNEPVFEYREVEIIRENEASYWCKGGIKAEDEIVAKGAFRIDATAQLANKNSLMNYHNEAKDKDPKVELASE